MTSERRSVSWCLLAVAVWLPFAKAADPLTLGASDRHFALRWPGAPDAAEPKGSASLQLHALSEPLCQMILLVNGAGPELRGTNAYGVSRLQGNDWRYLALDLAPAFQGRLTHYRRHLLFVEPDAFVIYDDLRAPEPAQFELILQSEGVLQVESKSGNIVLELPKAGLVARSFSAPLEALAPWRPVTNAPSPAAFQLHQLRAPAANRLSELRLLTVLMPHATGRKRASGFRFIQSDTAIGVRLYRDGLPTLAAFHTGPPGTEADFTGLRFSSPVAVDVFRPKVKRR